VPQKIRLVEIDCYAVRRELSNYLDDDLTPELRLQIERHIENCHHCTAVYDGMKDVVRLLNNKKTIDLPQGFSGRLYRRLLGGL